MRKKIAVLGFMLTLVAGVANAQTCGAIPNNLTNGTTADAAQVMANFNYVLGCINGLRGYLGGLNTSPDAGNPTTVIDTLPGIAASDDVTTMISLPTFKKNANAAWSVGSSSGCLDAASSLSASTWYHLFVVARTDTGVVDELCSTSATSPTMPAGYTKKRRIGSFRTDASAHILNYSQNGNEFLWIVAQHDVGITGTFGTSPALYTLTVPPGVSVNALMSVTTSANNNAYLLAQYQSSTQGTSAPPTDTGPNWVTANVRTNTSAQIQAYSQAAVQNLYIITNGWIDSRGQFQ